MKRLGFLYDMTRCIGCKACQVACKEKNKLGVGDFFRRVETLETTDRGSAGWVHFSGACNHCENPACVAVCPTGAMYIAEDGTVQHNDKLCVGCGRCVHHCPYGAPSLNKITGYAQKCNACYDLRQAGKNPACVDACPTRALHFGSLKQLEQEYDNTSCGDLSFLPPISLTKPSLLLRRRESAAIAGEIAPTIPPIIAEATVPVSLNNTNECFLILGGGTAAISAAKAIRLRNNTASIRILSSERRPPYCRPMLSKGHLNGFSMDSYSIVDDAWLKKNYIELELNCNVTAMDTAGKTVTLGDGRVLPYDKCVYAMGARCFLPPIIGNDKHGVFTLRSDEDLLAIRKQMLTSKNAIVIGGGITGLEIAWEIKKAGLHVTVLDLAPMLMGRLLDTRSSDVLRSRIEDAGITVVTNIKIQAIEGDKSVQSVFLEGGTVFPAELVILSTGFRANIAIAQAAGLIVNRAVAVDASMSTSNPDVYACGDCTDCGTSTWMQSVHQGEVAGANASGDALLYQALAEPAMVHTAGTSLLSIGDMGKQALDYQIFYGYSKALAGRYYVNLKQLHRRDTFYAFSFLEQRIVGATLIGNLSDMLFIQNAVQQQWTEQIFFEAAVKKGIEIYAE